MRWCLVALALALAGLPACQATPSPDTVVRAAFEGLSRYAVDPDQDLLKKTYDRLNRASQERLEHAAAALGKELGQEPPEPWQMLVSAGLAAGDRVSEVKVVGGDEGAGRVQVEVRFEWVVPTSRGGPADEPPPVVVDAVEEEGQWKVALWD